MLVITVKKNGIDAPEQYLLSEAAWPAFEDKVDRREAGRFDVCWLDGSPAPQLRTEWIADCW